MSKIAIYSVMFFESIVLLLSVVSNDDIRTHIRYDRVSLNTFNKYLAALDTSAKLNIFTLLPDRFIFEFVGYTVPGAHYIASFATYSLKNSLGYRPAWLATSLLEDKTTRSAAKHVSFLQFVLSVFGKDVSNVEALIGDNCNINQSIRLKMRVSLTACVSHCFQLAGWDILAEKENVISHVEHLMIKMRTSPISAKVL